MVGSLRNWGRVAAHMPLWRCPIPSAVPAPAVPRLPPPKIVWFDKRTTLHTKKLKQQVNSCWVSILGAVKRAWCRLTFGTVVTQLAASWCCAGAHTPENLRPRAARVPVCNTVWTHVRHTSWRVPQRPPKQGASPGRKPSPALPFPRRPPRPAGRPPWTVTSTASRSASAPGSAGAAPR